MSEASQGRQKRRETEDAESIDAALNPAKNYPRKRVAIACEVCRLRKTRCDANRPCGFCTEAGIECVYRPQNPAERRQSAASDVLVRIEDRLARLEEYLRPAHSEASTTPGSMNLGSLDVSAPPVLPQKSLLESPHQYGATSFEQKHDQSIATRPSITRFHCPHRINFESWDDTERLYDDEIDSLRNLDLCLEPFSDKPIYLHPTDTLRLRQIFRTNFLQWMPLFHPDVLEHCINTAQGDNYSSIDAETCLSLFACAIAEMSEQKELGVDYRNVSWGLHYFRRGSDILYRMKAQDRASPRVLQSQVLYACYYLFASLPLAAWDALYVLARDCMHLLRSSHVKRMVPAAREDFNRVFWICSILLDELEPILKTHALPLRQLREDVPLPAEIKDQEAVRCFSAQVGLRDLLTKMEDATDNGTNPQVSVAELRNQTDSWYSSLPLTLHFAEISTATSDLGMSYLRFQYVYLYAIAVWPSVLQVLKSNATRAHEHLQVDEHLVTAHREAQECVQHCVRACEVAEELLAPEKRHLGLQTTIWSSYSMLCMLLITYRIPGLGFIPETRNDRYIRKAYGMLKDWEHLSILKKALERTRQQMRRAQIPIDP